MEKKCNLASLSFFQFLYRNLSAILIFAFRKQLYHTDGLLCYQHTDYRIPYQISSCPFNLFHLGMDFLCIALMCSRTLYSYFFHFLSFNGINQQAFLIFEQLAMAKRYDSMPVPTYVCYCTFYCLWARPLTWTYSFLFLCF